MKDSLIGFAAAFTALVFLAILAFGLLCGHAWMHTVHPF